MELAATPETLEPRFLHLLQAEPQDKSHLPPQAQTEEEAGEAPLRLKNREGAREAPQRTTLKVHQTWVVRTPVLSLLCYNTAKLVSSPGVSWFISADELRSEARKENRPDKDEPTWRPSTSWFEPCSRIKPWREPLRQRQVPEDGNRQASFTHHSHPGVERRTKPRSSGLTRLSLQVSLCYRKSYLTNVDHPKVTIQSNVNKYSTFVLC